jgi:hypothetical protein
MSKKQLVFSCVFSFSLRVVKFRQFFLTKRCSKSKTFFHLSAKDTNHPYFLPEIVNIKTGNNTRLVIVPTTNVNEVSQPNALVPPKSLKLKMMNPAIKTKEVYMMLIPVCLMV